MTVPKINSAHGSDTRNIINRAIEVLNKQGKAMQDLVAEGQLTPEQYAEMIKVLNGLLTKGEVSVRDIDLNKGKFDSTYFSSEFLEDLNKGVINATHLLPGSVTRDILADKSATPDKTTFAKTTKNLFNKNDVIENVRLTTGTEISDDRFVTSDMIPVEPYTSYKRSHNAIINHFREDHSYITDESNNSSSFTAHQYASYIKVTVRKEDVEKFQLEKGTITTSYEPHGKVKMDDLSIDENNLNGTIMHKMNDQINTIYSGGLRINAEKDETPIDIIDFVGMSDPLYVTGGVGRDDYGKSSGRNLQGFKVSTTSSVTNIYSDFRLSRTGISAVNLLIYLEDASAIDNINVQFKNLEGAAYQWSRSSIPPQMKDGLNILRFAAHEGNIDNWGEFYGARIQISPNSPTDLTVVGLYGEAPNKAQLLFVQDGGYVEFLNNGYPDLKSRGIPTTWALNPGRLGTGRIISEGDVDELANDYTSAFSYHSWASEVHADMSAEELKENAIKCQRWLQKKGIQPLFPFRAAITQNNAPNHEALQDLVEAYSSPEGRATYEIFPFNNPYGFGRKTLHGMGNDSIDHAFDTMKKTHNLCIFYTHGVGPTATTGEQTQYDATPETWSYFISKIDAALAEGWLEGVTYDMLRMRYNKQFGGESYNAILNKMIGK